ncbi:MAG: oxidoreductase [Candidatus Sericytochromatia bacterium]
MIRTAVMGFGFSARTFHLPFLAHNPAFALVGLSTRQAEAQPLWPELAIYPTPEALLATCEADLIVITAPNAVHYELARQALAQGRHVVLEKPFVNTVAEGEALLALAAQQQRVLSVYHNRRWDGDFLTVQRLLQDQTLGSLRVLESHFDRFRPEVQTRWREQPGPGAGSWYDLGAHLLDQTLCLLGRPDALTARCLALRPGAQVTDFFHVQLHYPGCEVHLHGSPFVSGTRLRFAVHGSQGSYLKYGMDPQEERLKQGLLPLTPDWAAEVPAAYGQLCRADKAEVWPTLTGGYQAYYARLAEAIAGRGAIPVPAEEALQVIHLLELAERSSAEGRTLRLDPKA